MAIAQPLPIQIVVYVGSAPMRMVNRLELPTLTYNFRLIDIREPDGPELCESPFLGDNAISILANWPDRREGIRRILRRIAAQEPPRRAKAMAQLMILAGLRRLGDDIKTEVTQMPILEDIMDHDLLGPLLRRGQQEGRQEGRHGQEGRHEGELAVMLRQLRKRFGALPAGAEERLAARSVQQLEELSERILDCTSLEDLLG